MSSLRRLRRRKQRANGTVPGDPRIVYGATCVWWDSIQKVSTNGSGLPCCPFCAGVLYEMESEHRWYAQIERYAKETNQPRYRAMWEWSRGKCFPTMAALEAAWNAEEQKVATT